MKKECKRIPVKSIVTIMVTTVFCINTLLGLELTESFINIFLMIISFYFGTQHSKNEVIEKEKIDNVK